MTFVVNQEITDVFKEVRGTTDLVSSDFTATLLHNGSISTATVTITEISDGFYSVSFTPDDTGIWSLDIYVTAYTNAKYEKSYHVDEEKAYATDVTAIRSDISSLPEDILTETVTTHVVDGNVADYINKTKKYTSNRVLIDTDAETYIVKEDDGVGNYETGTVNSSERSPS